MDNLILFLLDSLIVVILLGLILVICACIFAMGYMLKKSFREEKDGDG